MAGQPQQTPPAPPVPKPRKNKLLIGCGFIVIAIIIVHMFAILAIYLHKPAAAPQKILAPENDSKVAQISNEEVEKIAQAFLRAVSEHDAEAAEALMFVPRELNDEMRSQFDLNSGKMTIAYQSDLTLLTTITEWYRIGGYAIGRLAPPLDDPNGASLCLLMGLKHHPSEWRVIVVEYLPADKALKEVFEEYRERTPGIR